MGNCQLSIDKEYLNLNFEIEYKQVSGLNQQRGGEDWDIFRRRRGVAN